METSSSMLTVREPFFLFRCDRDGDRLLGFGGALTLFFSGGGDLFVNSFSNLSLWGISNFNFLLAPVLEERD
jgi:hypothetical protein